MPVSSVEDGRHSSLYSQFNRPSKRKGSKHHFFFMGCVRLTIILEALERRTEGAPYSVPGAPTLTIFKHLACNVVLRSFPLLGSDNKLTCKSSNEPKVTFAYPSVNTGDGKANTWYKALYSVSYK